MKKLRILEKLSTNFLVLTIVMVVLIVPIVFYAILHFKLVGIEFLSSFVDISFKAIALLVGAIWTLNRLYVTRSDISHIKVEADVSKVASSLFGNVGKDRSLLLYRLDILNSSNTLLRSLKYFIEIKSVFPSNDSVEHSTIYRWPEKGFHPIPFIEPKSWNATNDAVAIKDEVLVIQLFLCLVLEDDKVWTWHKNYDLSNA